MTAAAASAHMRAMEHLTVNPAAPAIPDVITRLASAQDRATDSQTLWQLIDDQNDLVANTARGRLNLALRPVFEHHAVHIPVIDPVTGSITQ